MTKWRLTEKAKADECENTFQSGGPRVYVYDSNGRRRMTHYSASRAVRNAYADETVVSRRLRDGRYSWYEAKGVVQ